MSGDPYDPEADVELFVPITRGGIRWDQPGADAFADVVNHVGRMAHHFRYRHLPGYLVPCNLGVPGCTVEHFGPRSAMVASGGWCAPVVTSAYDLWSADPWRTRDRPWTAHLDVDRWLFPRWSHLTRDRHLRYRINAAGRHLKWAVLMLVKPLDPGDDDGG